MDLLISLIWIDLQCEMFFTSHEDIDEVELINDKHAVVHVLIALLASLVVVLLKCSHL
uniref:Uncharacterized protein n=1 Tax=Rhizophora mucronata TaxID=61149 RepID=A0A2P2NYP3_RHIMU